jgi:hypothetical protein
VKTCAVLTPRLGQSLDQVMAQVQEPQIRPWELRRKLSFRCRRDPLAIQAGHRSLARCKPSRRQLNLSRRSARIINVVCTGYPEHPRIPSPGGLPGGSLPARTHFPFSKPTAGCSQVHLNQFDFTKHLLSSHSEKFRRPRRRWTDLLAGGW